MGLATNTLARFFGAVKARAAVAATLGGAAVSSVWSRLGGLGIGSRLRFLLPGAQYDYEREAGDLWVNSVVAIAIKWAGDNAPKPRVRVQRILKGGDLEVQPYHPMVELLSRPNRHYTGRTLGKALILSLMCDGNAYLIKIRNAYKQVVALYWVPHWLMQPVWPEDGSVYIRAYQFLLDYQIVEIAPEDVIHFRDGIDPRNDRLGIAALKAQLRQVCSDNEVSGYTASILRNSGVPGLVVIPRDGKGKIERSQADRIQKKIADTLSGEQRGTASVFSEQVDISELGFSPEKLTLDKIPGPLVARILASLGLSPMVVGLPDPNKTYSNYAEATSAAWRQCLVPIQDLMAETYRWNLLPEFEDPARFVVDYDYTHVEALQEDLGRKHQRVRDDWKAGLVMHSEATTILGYEQDPDGDRYFPGTGGSGDESETGLPALPPPAGPDAAGDDTDTDTDTDTGTDGRKGRRWSY